MRKLLKPLSFLPAIFLMYMIFSFSSQTGDVSGQLSFKVSTKIIEAADYVFDANLEQWQIDEWANKINFITRKLAHMTEYFLLAIAVSFPLYVYGLHGLPLMLVAGFICVGFAALDEYHQSFVSGRAASMRDVAIDSVGIFFGIIVTRIIGWTGRKTIFRPKKPKVKRVKKRKQAYRDDPYYYPPQQQQPYHQAPNSNQPYYRQPSQSNQPPYQRPPQPNQQPYQRPSQPNQQPYQQPPQPNQQPHQQRQSEPFNQRQKPNYNQPPYMGESPQPPFEHQGSKNKTAKKKTKKEKDWFFDI